MEMIIEAKNHIIGSLIRQLQSVHISLPPMDLPDLSSYSSTTARRTPASHHDDPNLKPAENKVFEQNAEAQQGIDETTPQDTTTRVQKRGGSSDEHHSGSMQGKKSYHDDSSLTFDHILVACDYRFSRRRDWTSRSNRFIS